MRGASALARAMEQRKKEGQEAQARRRLLSIVDPDRKGEFDAMGLAELQGEQEGMALQRAVEQMKARVERERKGTELMEFQLGEQRKRAAGMDDFRGRVQRGGAVLEPFDTEMAATGAGGAELVAPMDRAGLLRAAAESGVLTPEMAMNLVPEGDAVPGSTRDLQGLPGYKYVVQNRQGAGSAVPIPGMAQTETPLQKANRENREVDTALKKQKLKGDATKGSGAPPAVAQEIQALKTAIAEDEAAIAGNDKNRGLFNMWSREANLEENKARLKVLLKHFPEEGGEEVEQKETKREQGAGDKVMVEKNGKRFRVPRRQVEEAKAQGYRLVE